MYVNTFASDAACVDAYMFFNIYGNPRDLHVLTHSVPTRRSSDLYVGADEVLAENPDVVIVATGSQPIEAQDFMQTADPACRIRIAPDARVLTDRKSTRLNSSH